MTTDYLQCERKGHHVTDWEWNQLLEKVQPLLEQADWVAMGGSLPPGVPTDAFRTLGNLAKEHNCKVMLDAMASQCSLALNVFPILFAKMSARQNDFSRELVDNEVAICEAAKELQAQLKNGGSHDPVVIISRGKKGAILADEHGILIEMGSKCNLHRPSARAIRCWVAISTLWKRVFPVRKPCNTASRQGQPPPLPMAPRLAGNR
ncbi:MAG: PfkB family carbohydrate kinase [Fimbriimonadaceae bacterium]